MHCCIYTCTTQIKSVYRAFISLSHMTTGLWEIDQFLCASEKSTFATSHRYIASKQILWLIFPILLTK